MKFRLGNLIRTSSEAPRHRRRSATRARGNSCCFTRARTEILERRTLLVASLNSVSPIANLGFAIDGRDAEFGLLQFEMNTDNDVGPEIQHNYGFGAAAPAAGGVADTVLVGNLTGNGVDYPVTVREFNGQLMWLGDTDHGADGNSNDELRFMLGVPGDIPLIGDFNDDGIDEPVVARLQSDNTYQWIRGIRPAGGFPESDFTRGDGDALETEVLFSRFGFNGDRLVVGDWNGDGHDEPGLVSSAPGNGDRMRWFLGTRAVDFGTFGAGLEPVVGDFRNVGHDELAVVQRRSTDALLTFADHHLGVSNFTALGTRETIVYNHPNAQKFLAGQWTQPEVRISDVTVIEGNSGRTNATFTVSLVVPGDPLQAHPSQVPVTVSYATASATATAGSDFDAISGTLTFEPGETQKEINVEVNGDTEFEPTETFHVNLSGLVNVRPGDLLGIGHIQNDDLKGAVSGAVWNDLNGNGVRDTDLIAGDEPDVVFVVDVSGSTSNNFSGTAVGDVNGDGESDTILDAVLQGFIDLNNELIAAGFGDTAEVAIVVFANGAATIDTNVLSGASAAFVTPATDRDGNGTSDVEDVLRSLTFDDLPVASDATRYDEGLREAADTFLAHGTAAGQGNVLFISDGVPVPNTQDYTDEVATLRSRQVQVRAFGARNDGDTAAQLAALQIIDPESLIFTSTDELRGVFGNLMAPERFTEPGLADVVVYADLNNNGVWDGNEPSVVSRSDDPATFDVDETGLYTLDDLAPGTVTIRQEVPSGFRQTFPTSGTGHTATVVAGTDVAGLLFGDQQIVVSALSDLMSGSTIRLDGELVGGSGGRSGRSVASVGDFNGDGFDDVVVTGDSYYGGSPAVVFGRANREPSPLLIGELDGSDGFRILGDSATPEVELGNVFAAGDVNGDGFDDVLISAGDAPAGYVLFGTDAPRPASVSLGDLDGSNGFRIDWPSQGPFQSTHVVPAGDLNGDGFADFFVGEDVDSLPIGLPDGFPGLLIFGQATGIPAQLDLDSPGGVMTAATLGLSPDGLYDGRTIGDINGDGFDDLKVFDQFEGEHLILLGGAEFPTDPIQASSLDGSNGFSFGSSTGSFFTPHPAGDVNGDGIDDLLISELTPVSGSGSDLMLHLLPGQSDGFTAIVDPSATSGSGRIMLPGMLDGHELGFDVRMTGVGDINSAGFGDVLIAARYEDSSDNSGFVVAFVVYGRADVGSLDVELEDLFTAGSTSDGSALLVIEEDDTSRFSISGGGDFDNDGALDFLIGASGFPADASERFGTTYVVFGEPEAASTELGFVPSLAVRAEGNSGSTEFTFNLTRSGDVSAEGSVDFTVTSGDANGASAADFVGGVFPSGTVSFAAGETSQTITINVSGDTDVEPDETFMVTLSNASGGATITTATIQGTILNDDSVGGSRPVQRVVSDLAMRTVISRGVLEVPVFYSTLDSNGDPAALAANLLDVNLHFDTDRLTFLGFVSSSEFTEGRVTAGEFSESPSGDFGDDGDAATETVIRTSFTDSDALQVPGWPNAESTTPLQLYVARFEVADFTGTTTLNFSANAEANVVGQPLAFGFSSQSVTVNVVQATGNIDGDDDFDANDSFLLNIVLLGATDAQIDLFKGASPLTAAEIRTQIEQLRNSAVLDVDGDGDTDANDTFLTNISKLGATDAQLNLFKGASPLAAGEIRGRVDSLFTQTVQQASRPRPEQLQQPAPLTPVESAPASVTVAGSGSWLDEEEENGHLDRPAADALFVTDQFEELLAELM